MYPSESEDSASSESSNSAKPAPVNSDIEDCATVSGEKYNIRARPADEPVFSQKKHYCCLAALVAAAALIVTVGVVLVAVFE